MRRGSIVIVLAALSSTALLPTSAAHGSTPHNPVGPVRPRPPVAVAPRRVPVPTGQRITGRPAVLAAVNAARAQRGWSPAAAGSNFAAEACALSATHCNGVQWGGCRLAPLPGDQYTATIGSAESNGPRGCVLAISYSAFS